ncbi:hypothetical protein DPMN_046053 [Dreissena polymorpha]|uniref:Uncharacterized protein n=1 Tax=Dreissena polymorpha TaxID=45954 RepID=A0A9D3YYS8_DREPO|nr:hypothetical protein DPMN_066340 [Dreissena polymorpha]KAH3706969.1 hypothetical protein DPMN_066360 [Dreissena polymorpha]KAH3739401.1 hypothetical protein DPMN_046053 [Dreissena polymorpha]
MFISKARESSYQPVSVSPRGMSSHARMYISPSSSDRNNCRFCSSMSRAGCKKLSHSP